MKVTLPEMRDARLAELQLLADLETRQRDFLFVDGLGANETYGLGKDRFRELVLHLLLEGCVNGPASITSLPGVRLDPTVSGVSIPEPVNCRLAAILDDELRHIFERNAATLRLNHKGRLRLWTLRDELLAIDELDAFGILFGSRYWKRDLEIEMIFSDPHVANSLLLCDLDKFKPVNDKYGHPFGNQVIQAYLQAVKDGTARLGKGYRIGGDEVAVILPRIDEAKGKKIATEIQFNFQRTLTNQDEFRLKALDLTVSIGGVTFFGNKEASFLDEQTDSLLYQAKKGGGNQIKWVVLPT